MKNETKKTENKQNNEVSFVETKEVNETNKTIENIVLLENIETTKETKNKELSFSQLFNENNEFIKKLILNELTFENKLNFVKNFQTIYCFDVVKCFTDILKHSFKNYSFFSILTQEKNVNENLFKYELSKVLKFSSIENSFKETKELLKEKVKEFSFNEEKKFFKFNVQNIELQKFESVRKSYVNYNKSLIESNKYKQFLSVLNEKTSNNNVYDLLLNITRFETLFETLLNSCNNEQEKISLMKNSLITFSKEMLLTEKNEIVSYDFKKRKEFQKIHELYINSLNEIEVKKQRSISFFENLNERIFDFFKIENSIKVFQKVLS